MELEPTKIQDMVLHLESGGSNERKEVLKAAGIRWNAAAATPYFDHITKEYPQFFQEEEQADEPEAPEAEAPKKEKPKKEKSMKDKQFRLIGKGGIAKELLFVKEGEGIITLKEKVDEIVTVDIEGTRVEGVNLTQLEKTDPEKAELYRKLVV